MNHSQFGIASIELNHIQAIQLKKDCIEAIENYGIENFEANKKEIPVSDENDLLQVAITCETFTDESEVQQPDIPTIKGRCVHISLKLSNIEGNEVKLTVKGQNFYNNLFKRNQVMSPIDVENEIVKHFQI